jgi:hypothetical protein
MQTMRFVRSCVYLGAIIHESQTDDAEIPGRILKATQMFGMLRKEMLASKDTWNEVKRRIMEGMIIPTMLDGAEHWVVSSEKRRELNSCFNRMIRSCLRINLYTTRKHKITTEMAHSKIGVGNLDYYLDLRALGCAGHVQRMGEERLPKIMRDSFLDLPQKRGRPLRPHADQTRDGLKRKQTSITEWKNIAANTTEWKRAIRAPSIYTDKNNNRFAEWPWAPKMLLGSTVEKQFGQKWYAGEICDCVVDTDTNEVMWEMLYDDGDRADYNCKQLEKIICEGF